MNGKKYSQQTGNRSILPRRLRENSPCQRENGPVPYSRPAFTLFELLLAVALSAVLLALIGAAINLYLMQVDASRTRVEEAQLARSILAMIADDLRAATVYKPQDTSTFVALVASSMPFDVDSIDRPSSTLSPGGATRITSGGMGSSGGGGAGSGIAGSVSASSGQSSASGMGAASDETLPLGLNGALEEIYVDVTRLPRMDELFSTETGYTNAPLTAPDGGIASDEVAAAGAARPSDLKTVHYFIREGDAVDLDSPAATSLDPDEQLRAGGLVRQEIGRAARVWAEQSGNSALLESGQALVAPEVVHIEFRYFDGDEVIDDWDMQERDSLPLAIEVRLWLAAPNAEDEPTATRYDAASLETNAHEYRQTVFLSMSGVSGCGASSGTGTSSSSSSMSSSSSSAGSGFGQTQ